MLQVSAADILFADDSLWWRCTLTDFMKALRSYSIYFSLIPCSPASGIQGIRRNIFAIFRYFRKLNLEIQHRYYDNGA